MELRLSDLLFTVLRPEASNTRSSLPLNANGGEHAEEGLCDLSADDTEEMIFDITRLNSS